MALRDFLSLEKMPHVAASNENISQKNDIIKNRPKDKYYFF